jgi:phosphoribosylaminoimidazole carboxylase PurE protein
MPAWENMMKSRKSRKAVLKSVKPEVGLLMGSDSDWPLVGKAAAVLGEFGVPCEVSVISAHRTPDRAAKYARDAAKRGLKVIICAAGGAAHLAGAIAANTTLPVIGIPVEGGSLHGLDALLATVQMPAGVPVATVALGGAGPANAALLAVQILAVSNPALGAKLKRYKQELKRKVETGNARVRKSLQECAGVKASGAARPA